MSLVPFFFDDPFFDPFVSPLPHPRRSDGNQALVPATTDLSRGWWDWNRALAEPMSMSLNDRGNEYVMDVSAPSGMSGNDLKLDLNNDVLTVSGAHSDEKRDAGEWGSRYVSSSSSFSRSVKLPKNVDQTKIAANFTEDGRLSIQLPKKDDASKKRSIAIAGQKQISSGNEEKKQ